MRVTLNPLIPHWFDGETAQIREFILRCSIKTSGLSGLMKKISLAKFSFRSRLSGRAEFVRFTRRAKMAWKTPKIVEVPVGMEINMYACAARK